MLRLNAMVNVTKTASKKMLWPDIIRIISVFLVILIHTSAVVVLSWKKVNTADWMFGNFYDSIARISVPLFVMLSGSLLINKKDSLKLFFKKRFKRIVLPWFFWGTILLFVSNINEIRTFFYDPIYDISKIKIILMENYLSGFWFMPMIVGIYLSAPIIKKFAVNASKYELKYFLFIWFVIASLIPTANRLFGLSISFVTPVWFAYLGYFVGGYYIVHKTKITKLHLQQSKIIFSACLIITILGTYLLSSLNNQFIDYLYEYLSVNVVLMSFATFVILFNYFKNIELNHWLTKYIHLISDNSYGILLSHIIIIKYLPVQSYPLITIPLSTIIIFSLTYYLVNAMKKISFIKHISG